MAGEARGPLTRSGPVPSLARRWARAGVLAATVLRAPSGRGGQQRSTKVRCGSASNHPEAKHPPTGGGEPPGRVVSVSRRAHSRPAGLRFRSEDSSWSESPRPQTRGWVGGQGRWVPRAPGPAVGLGPGVPDAPLRQDQGPCGRSEPRDPGRRPCSAGLTSAPSPFISGPELTFRPVFPRIRAAVTFALPAGHVPGGRAAALPESAAFFRRCCYLS